MTNLCGLFLRKQPLHIVILRPLQVIQASYGLAQGPCISSATLRYTLDLYFQHREIPGFFRLKM